MNVKEKYSSNREVEQREVVTYGKSRKDWRKEKQIHLSFVVQSVHSTISQESFMDVP